MDHHFEVGAQGVVDGYEDRYYSGRRPCGFYIPRFRNVGNDRREYLRGFGYQGGAGREGWSRAVAELGDRHRAQGGAEHPRAPGPSA